MDYDGRRPVILVTGRQRPHEVLLLALSVPIGAGYLLGAPPPASIEALIPPAWVHAWAAGLLASGLVGLLSLVGGPGSVERRMRVEAGAMLLGAGSVLLSTYATVQYATGLVHPSQAILSVCTGSAWAGANVWRVWQIRRDLREWRRQLGT